MLFPVGIPGLTAESEAGAQWPAEPQGAVGPGSHRAGGEGPGGVAVVPLQQLLPQPPVHRKGHLGLSRAVAVHVLALPGVGGTKQLQGGCGQTAERSEEATLPSAQLCPNFPDMSQLTLHKEAHGCFQGAQQVLSLTDVSPMVHQFHLGKLQDPRI